MALTRCRKCDEYNDDRHHSSFNHPYREPIISVECKRVYREVTSIHLVQLEGIITCRYDGNIWPVKLYDNIIDPTLPIMPITESRNLSPNVPNDQIEDMREAERAYFSQCFKASVVMCRRAMQLALESKGAQGRTLGQVLQNERTMPTRILQDKNIETMLEAVKDYGDSGAHRSIPITHQEANIMIYTAVKVLNHIFR